MTDAPQDPPAPSPGWTVPRWTALIPLGVSFLCLQALLGLSPSLCRPADGWCTGLYTAADVIGGGVFPHALIILITPAFVGAIFMLRFVIAILDIGVGLLAWRRLPPRLTLNQIAGVGGAWLVLCLVNLTFLLTAVPPIWQWLNGRRLFGY